MLKNEQAILAVWKRTNYNDQLWSFFANPSERSLEIRIEGDVLHELGTLAQDGDVEGMLGAYFQRHATNSHLCVDGDILIFSKDPFAEHIPRSYVRVPRLFLHVMYAVFSMSAALLLTAFLCFIIRIMVDSELIDAILILSLFSFLVDATFGIAAVLCGYHRPTRDPEQIQKIATIHFIPLL